MFSPVFLKQGIYASYIITIVVFVFDAVYSNQKRFDELLIEYQKFSDKEKERGQVISPSICLITVIGYFIALSCLLNP